MQENPEFTGGVSGWLETLKGQDGKDGSMWFTGTMVTGTGNSISKEVTGSKVGDMYLNTTSYDIYQCTATSTWKWVANIKGAQGLPGEDGVAAEASVPSYWKTYLDTKIAAINAKTEAYGPEADAFIYIGDQHLDGTTDYGAALINYITKNTSIKKVFFGGDLVQGSANDNKYVREYRESFNSDLLIMGMRGNHDVSASLNADIYWDIMCRPNIDRVEMGDELYYHYDNEAQKIRYIVTDSVAHGTSDLTDATQIAWMQEKILELDSDWTTVIFHHGVYEAHSSNPTLEMNADGKLIVNAIDAIYDQASCTIAGVYTGHAHRDYVGYSDKGYPIVVTTVDTSHSGLAAYDPVNKTRTNGTTTEQTFDVVILNPTTHQFETIRIGAGDTNANRTIAFAEKELQELTGVSLNKTSAKTWINGANISLTANLIPGNVANKNVTWSIKSQDNLGCTLTSNGLNCTFRPGATTGTVVVEVKTQDGNYTAECTIEIVEEMTSVSLTEEFGPWTPGAIKYADGKEYTNNSDYTRDWVFSSYVNVSEYVSITFTQAQTKTENTALGYAFYDANKNVIANSGASNSSPDKNYMPVEKTVTVPTGAVYFRTMWIKETHEFYNAEIHEITENFYCYGNFTADYVGGPEEAVSVTGVELDKSTANTWVSGPSVTLTASVLPAKATNKAVTWTIKEGEGLGSIVASGLTCAFTPGETAGTVVIEVKTEDGNFTKECAIEITEAATVTDLTSQFEWTVGTLTYTTGVFSDTDTNWKTSNLVDVSAYKSITFSHIQTKTSPTVLGYVFYAANGTTVVGGASNTSPLGDYVPAHKTIDVPTGAVYFRTMWMNTAHSTVYDNTIHNISNFYCYGNPYTAAEAPSSVTVRSVALDKTEVTVGVGGGTVTLNAVVNPYAATNKNVTWRIKGDDLGCELVANGASCTITIGTTAGTIEVEVATVEGDYTAVCTITITADGSLDITSQFTTWTPGAIKYASGQVDSSDSNFTRDWVYSNLVDISMFESIEFMHIQTENTDTSLGFSFYAADGTTVVAGGKNNGESSSYNPIVQEVEVPDGAVYIRVMWMNTTHSKYKEYIEDKDVQFYFKGYFDSNISE